MIANAKWVSLICLFALEENEYDVLVILLTMAYWHYIVT